MIRIYGASDDLVEIEGHPDGDEIGCYEQDVIVVLKEQDRGGVAVRMSYAPRFLETEEAGFAVGSACWSAEIVQMADSAPIPWPVRIRHEMRGKDVGYSVVVEIDAPESVIMRIVKVPATVPS